MNLSPHNNMRLDYLDAVRSFALILGIIFHASLSFTPIFIGWAVMDISTSHLVSVFILISHCFRMALFFLIAGFFSHMKFHQHGMPAFLNSRLLRIALPFVLGWFLLKPLLISGWIIGAESMRGDVNILNGLLASLANFGTTLPSDLLVGSHLWFLYYLLIISVSVVLFRHCVELHKPTQNILTQWGDRFVNWFCNSRLAILLAAIPTAACLWFMSHWGMDTPDKSLIPNLPLLLIYCGFFLFGWFAQRHATLIIKFAELTWHKLLLCILATISAIALSSFELKYGHSYYWLIKASFMLSYAVMMWSLIALTIGLGKQLFSRPNRLMRYIADASYWLYLIHLPIVVWLQIAFAELPLHWLIKLISISAITLFISITIYDAMVRSTFIGAVLNGKRKQRYFFNVNWASIRQKLAIK